MRRVDLDELPQLWNVLQGEMSLVGPRPEMPYHSETFSRRIPGYAQRLAVRPGLTGLAQVRGWRANTSIEHRLRSDLEYIGNRGSLMYGRVLFATIGSKSEECLRNPPSNKGVLTFLISIRDKK